MPNLALCKGMTGQQALVQLLLQISAPLRHVRQPEHIVPHETAAGGVKSHTGQPGPT